MYPNYVYRPQRSKDKKGKKGRRGELEHEQDSEHTISFVLPMTMPTTSKHGRSVSAPTPTPVPDNPDPIRVHAVLSHFSIARTDD